LLRFFSADAQFTKLNAAGSTFAALIMQDSQLSFAQLQNKSGAFVTATPESGTTTLNATQFSGDNLRVGKSVAALGSIE
jgi:hypothetical protein